MEQKYLLKKDVDGLLAGLCERYAVYAPEVGERAIEFAPMTADSSVRLTAPGSKWPIKRFLFPQSESLLKYDFAAAGRDRVAAVVPDDAPVLLYGARPCDARSFDILDKVFLEQEGVVDPYYAVRRERTTVVAVACDTPASTCFCSSVEGNPHGTEGCDVLLRDAGEGYIVEIVTDKGAAAMEGAALAPVDGAALETVEANKTAAEEKAAMATKPREFFDSLMNIFEDDVWGRIHEKCVGCGACTYLCPTCHCFDIQDEQEDKEGRRVRNWDSCMSPTFTLHASGHNPRESGRERWRQRAMHKFNYYPTKFGPFACVGCGRCVKDCPTGVDIREILADLQEAVTSHV